VPFICAHLSLTPPPPLVALAADYDVLTKPWLTPLKLRLDAMEQCRLMWSKLHNFFHGGNTFVSANFQIMREMVWVEKVRSWILFSLDEGPPPQGEFLYDLKMAISRVRACLAYEGVDLNESSNRKMVYARDSPSILTLRAAQKITEMHRELWLLSISLLKLKTATHKLFVKVARLKHCAKKSVQRAAASRLVTRLSDMKFEFEVEECSPMPTETKKRARTDPGDADMAGRDLNDASYAEYSQLN